MSTDHVPTDHGAGMFLRQMFDQGANYSELGRAARRLFGPLPPEAGAMSTSDGLGGEHLDFVEVVEVFGREDGVYVFGELTDAERFQNAVAAGQGLTSEDAGSASYCQETPINVGAAAERLIAAERGDVLEDRDWPNVAEDVREGVALQTIVARLTQEGGEVDEAVALLGKWIAEDNEARVGEGRKTSPVAAGFDAARKIAAFLAEPGDWNGGDVCDVAAEALIEAGLLTKEQCNN